MKRRVLILGGRGMLGHSLFSQYSQHNDIDVYVTLREAFVTNELFPSGAVSNILLGVDVFDLASVIGAVTTVKPDVVINCIAWINPAQISKDPLAAICVNSEFPHRLALMCQKLGARLVHISSDVVFDGKKGMYIEQDRVGISDFYGMTKFLGEVNYPNCVTIRTSIIGHELVRKTALVDWFLSQKTKVRGYTKAIYSGFPTIELARIISEYILPNEELSGVYHVSSEPISKYDLLRLIANRYGKQIEIEPDNGFVMDRSLNSGVFRSLTGYVSPSWLELVDKMYIDQNKCNSNINGDDNG